MIRFTVPMTPVAKGRHRTGNGRPYTPERTRKAEATIKHFGAEAMRGRALMDGPLEMNITAIYPRAKSWSKKKRETMVWKTSRSDLDNIVKLVADSLNATVYPDDAAVAKVSACKIYGDQAALIIEVKALDHATT